MADPALLTRFVLRTFAGCAYLDISKLIVYRSEKVLLLLLVGVNTLCTSIGWLTQHIRFAFPALKLAGDVEVITSAQMNDAFSEAEVRDGMLATYLVHDTT